MILCRFYDLARLDALRAYLDPAVAARRHFDADRLKVGIKSAPGLVVSV